MRSTLSIIWAFWSKYQAISGVPVDQSGFQLSQTSWIPSTNGIFPDLQLLPTACQYSENSSILLPTFQYSENSRACHSPFDSKVDLTKNKLILGRFTPSTLQSPSMAQGLTKLQMDLLPRPQDLGRHSQRHVTVSLRHISSTQHDIMKNLLVMDQWDPMGESMSGLSPGESPPRGSWPQHNHPWRSALLGLTGSCIVLASSLSQRLDFWSN